MENVLELFIVLDNKEVDLNSNNNRSSNSNKINNQLFTTYRIFKILMQDKSRI